jgi:hypothetical protein
MNTPVGIPNDRKDIESWSGYHKFLVGTLIARVMVVGCRFVFHHMYQHHLMILLFARKSTELIPIKWDNLSLLYSLKMSIITVDRSAF